MEWSVMELEDYRCGCLYDWLDGIENDQIRLLASMNYIGIMKIVQAKQDLIKGGFDKNLLEDFVFLHLLQGSKAHSQWNA
jgi:hypothetical protein